MLTVELKSLGKQVGPAVRYLKSQLSDSLSVHGTQVKLTSTKARTAKLLLHKFSSYFVTVRSNRPSHYYGRCSAFSEGCDCFEPGFLEHGDCSSAHVV